MNAKVKEWNDKTAIEKILTVRGTGLREEIYDVALAELAAKDAELAALRQVVEAARKLQVKMLRVYNTPEYQTVWSIAQSHVGKYEGGNWIDEFDELAAELARVDGEKGYNDERQIELL